MKREFLKSLGIEDKETIDKILDENSDDIGKAKGELETVKNQVSELKSQLTERDNQLKELKEVAADNETLTSKITELEQKNEATVTEYNTKISQLQKTHAIESGVRDAKAKNIKAVMALLDMDKIEYKDGELKGLSEQLKDLTENENSSFLFGDSKPGAPSGTKLNDPPAGGGSEKPKTLSEAIANALNQNKN